MSKLTIIRDIRSSNHSRSYTYQTEKGLNSTVGYTSNDLAVDCIGILATLRPTS